MEKQSSLMNDFGNNVMKDELLTLDLTIEEIEGLPEFLVEELKSTASEKEKPEGTYSVTLSRSLMEPFLMYCPDRELREKAYECKERTVRTLTFTN